MSSSGNWNGAGYTVAQAARLKNPPPYFLCGGHAPDDTPCNAHLTLRALESKVVRPYFGALKTHPHIPGCDAGAEDTGSRTQARRKAQVVLIETAGGPETVRVKDGQSLQVRPPRSSTLGVAPSQWPGAIIRRKSGNRSDAPRKRTVTLRQLLDEMVDIGYLNAAKVEIPDKGTFPARDAVITACDAVELGVTDPAYYWGIFTGAAHTTAFGGYMLPLTGMTRERRANIPALLVSERQLQEARSALSIASFDDGVLRDRPVIFLGRLKRPDNHPYIALDGDVSLHAWRYPLAKI